jgi:hypothetical protein
MKGVIRVECEICGPLVECKDSTMMEAFATHHERDHGDEHRTDLVVG